MRMPGYTGETSISSSRSTPWDAGALSDLPEDVVLPQLAYTCVGKYCDCDGTADCVDMINHKCGRWTRCVVIGGTLRCLCEPRALRA